MNFTSRPFNCMHAHAHTHTHGTHTHGTRIHTDQLLLTDQVPYSMPVVETIYKYPYQEFTLANGAGL